MFSKKKSSHHKITKTENFLNSLTNLAHKNNNNLLSANQPHKNLENILPNDVIYGCLTVLGTNGQRKKSDIDERQKSCFILKQKKRGNGLRIFRPQPANQILNSGKSFLSSALPTIHQDRAVNDAGTSTQATLPPHVNSGVKSQSLSGISLKNTAKPSDLQSNIHSNKNLLDLGTFLEDFFYIFSL